MFGFGKNKVLKDDKFLYAPFDGNSFEMEKVSDPVFSKKILGDGFAMTPESSQILSPVTGKVVLIEGHAVGLRRADGLEILLHMGIDTVNLMGEPFILTIKLGDVVEGGQVLGRVDWNIIEQAGYEKTTLVIFTNGNDHLNSFDVNYGGAKAGARIGAASVK